MAYNSPNSSGSITYTSRSPKAVMLSLSGTEQGQRQSKRLGRRLAAGEFPEKKPLHRELNGNSVRMKDV